MDSGEAVPVRLKKEPVDSFDCSLNDQWKRIGYVVQKIVNDVHAAIDQGKIVGVKFAWCKFKMWKRAPAYYAAVLVTRKGQWSTKVKKAFSSFFLSIVLTEQKYVCAITS